jgi:hypothetical protein
MDGETSLLDALGLDYELLDSGCCGMAGSFGFEEDKYELSQEIGERVLLPAVRNAPDETLVIADGFSCREQIAQATSRRALHLAQVLQLALHEGRDIRLNGEPPERAMERLRPRALARPRASSIAVTAAVATAVSGAAVLGGVMAWRGAGRMMRSRQGGNSREGADEITAAGRQ